MKRSGTSKPGEFKDGKGITDRLKELSKKNRLTEEE